MIHHVVVGVSEKVHLLMSGLAKGAREVLQDAVLGEDLIGQFTWLTQTTPGVTAVMGVGGVKLAFGPGVTKVNVPLVVEFPVTVELHLLDLVLGEIGRASCRELVAWSAV